jgi:hypothetical protein
MQGWLRVPILVGLGIVLLYALLATLTLWGPV